MSDLTAYARLRAYSEGRAVRLASQRNFPISDHPLVLIPIQMAGEAPALFAIGVGDLEGNLVIHTCPSPVNRDHQYALLAAFACTVQPVLNDWRTSRQAVPQVVSQSDAAATLALAVFDRMAYLNPAQAPTPLIRDIGRQLVFFDRRFERPDTAAIISATALLTAHFATGQDPHADTHLGAAVEWLKPADGRVLERVAAAEKLPASASMDPEIDNLMLEPVVSNFHQAEAAGDSRGAAAARRSIHDVLEPEVRRRYELVLAAVNAVRAIPATDFAGSIAMRDWSTFNDHVTYVATNPGLPRGFKGDSGIVEYVHRDKAHRDHLADSINAGGRERAEARVNGEVLHGEVIGRREARQGRARIVEYDVLSGQTRMRTRPGAELALLDNASDLRFRLLATERRTGGVVATLRMTAGMTKQGHPARGDNVAFGPIKYFSRRSALAHQRLATAGTRAAVTGRGKVTNDFLSVVAALERRR